MRLSLKRVWAKVKGAVRRRMGGTKKSPPKRRRFQPLPQPALLPAPAPLSTLPQVPVFAAIEEFSLVQLSVHTQRAYRKDLRDFFGFLKIEGIWTDWNGEVSPILVARFRSSLTEKGLAKGSVTRKLAVVKSFFRWAKSRGWIDSNPAELVRGFPQTQDSKTGFLSEDEIHKVLARFGDVADVGLSEALAKTGIETLLMLGLRRSEAVAIRAGDLEYNEGRWLLKVKGKGDRERRLPLPPRLRKTWSAWWQRIDEEAPRVDMETAPAAWLDWGRRDPNRPLLVSSRARSLDHPLSSAELARLVRGWCRKAGLVNRVSPHMLRATAITYALDKGASHRGIQQMAGWTSPLMISRYDKRRNDPRFSAVEQLDYAKFPLTDDMSMVLPADRARDMPG